MSKVLWHKILFQYLSLIYYPYEAVSGNTEWGDIKNLRGTHYTDGHQSISSSEYILKELYQHLLNACFLYSVLLNVVNSHCLITSVFY
jgi:hypothetical protein